MHKDSARESLRSTRLGSVLLLITTIFLSTTLVSLIYPVHAQTSLSVFSEDYFAADIVDPTLTIGSVFTLDIVATDAPTINGFDITVKYDAAVLKATEADWRPPLCSSEIYSCLFPSNSFPVSKEVDSPAGRTRLALVVLAGSVSGTGIVFSIKFQVMGTGFARVEIMDGTVLSDPLIKFEDITPTNNGIWNSGESVVYDVNDNNQFDLTDIIIDGNPSQPSVALTVDPKLVFLDANHNSVWDEGESVVYDSDGNGKFHPGEPVVAGAEPDVSRIVLGSVEMAYSTVNGSFENRFPYKVSVSPDTGVLPNPGTVTADVNVSLVWTTSSFLEIINLATTSVPSDTTASLSPNMGDFTIQNSFVSQITITTASLTPAGIYPIIINATSRFESPITGTILTTIVTATFTLTVDATDIAILSITPSVSQALQGDQVSISADVRNKGLDPETFTVTVMANSTVITSQEVTVNGAQTQTLTVVWNTTNLALGIYEISGEVPVLTGETITSDNSLTDGMVKMVSGFSVNANPTSTTIKQGEQTTTLVTVTSSSQTSTSVILSLSNLPSGVTGSFDPPNGSPSFMSTLTITASATSNVGVFQLQIIAASADLTRTASFSLTVQLVRDIAITDVTGNPTTANPGTTIAVSIAVANNGGASESFTVDLYAGVSKVASGNVASLAPGATTTLDLSWSTTGVAPGLYQLRAEVSALPGEENTADNSKTGNSIRINAPPSPQFTYDPVAPNQGQTVQFDASQSTDPDPSDFVTSYQWNFGDGATGTSVTTSHAYQVSGRYVVTLTVTDYFGGSASTSQEIIVNAPPSASFTFAPASPTAGQTVSFDASQSIDIDGSIENYSWNFGDGTTGTGRTPSHTYQAAGTYEVRLTVTDNSGAAHTRTVQIAVGQATSGVSPLTSPLGLSAITAAVVLIIVGALLYARSRRGASTPPRKK